MNPLRTSPILEAGVVAVAGPPRRTLPVGIDSRVKIANDLGFRAGDLRAGGGSSLAAGQRVVGSLALLDVVLVDVAAVVGLVDGKHPAVRQVAIMGECKGRAAGFTFVIFQPVI